MGNSGEKQTSGRAPNFHLLHRVPRFLLLFDRKGYSRELCYVLKSGIRKRQKAKKEGT